MPHIALIVEGDGEKGALPVLVRERLQTHMRFDVKIGKPINTKGRGKLLKDGELERFVQLAATEPDAGAVLVLCDADNDPACVLGPRTQSRCESVARDVPVRATLAVKEFENWIVASWETMEMASDPIATDDFDAVPAVPIVQSWFAPRSYVKPLHQPRLAARVDQEVAAARSASFARLLRCIDELAAALS